MLRITGVPAARFNGANISSAFDDATLADALTRVAESGLPFSLQARPAVADAVTAAAVRSAFVEGVEMAFWPSSPMGVGVCQGMGFRPLEWWSSWERSEEA